MRTKSMHFRTILNTVTRRSSCLLRLERTLACSSSSLRTQQSVLPQTFLRDSDDNDLLVRRLCGDGKFKDAIDVLCLQNRLKEAIEVLGCVDHPSAATYSTLLQLCLQQRAIREGKIVHDHVKLSGFTPGIFISNRLLDLFCKCESVVAARNVFDKMPQKDVCSWNTMISGYAKVGMLEDARKLFDEMPERDNFSWTAMVSGYVRHDRPNDALALYRVMQRYEKLNCNKFTVSSALSASASIKSLNFGKEIHAHIIRAGLDSDAFVWSALSDMYGKCRSIDDARRIFDKTIDKDIVSWTSMIDIYFKDGRREEGFLLFYKL